MRLPRSLHDPGRRGVNSYVEIQPEALPVPADDGLGPCNHERVHPAQPESEEGDAGCSVRRCESRARMLLRVGCELLGQTQLDRDLLAARPEESRQGDDENPCVREESPRHPASLGDLVGEIEPDSGA